MCRITSLCTETREPRSEAFCDIGCGEGIEMPFGVTRPVFPNDANWFTFRVQRFDVQGDTYVWQALQSSGVHFLKL